jgi:hypothetical protein
MIFAIWFLFLLAQYLPASSTPADEAGLTDDDGQ